jgi:hypothetical protein
MEIEAIDLTGGRQISLDPRQRGRGRSPVRGRHGRKFRHSALTGPPPFRERPHSLALGKPERVSSVFTRHLSRGFGRRRTRRLSALAGSNRDDRPRSDDAVAIRIDSPLPNPWTEEALLRYYPEEDIVQLGPGSFVRLDAELAADVEAARALGSDGSGVPWAVVAGALAAVVLVVLAAASLARRLWVRVPAKPT